jgi:hypothetical protein
MLFQHLDVRDGHAAVDGFAHVVDGEQGDWGSYTNQQLSPPQALALARFLPG